MASAVRKLNRLNDLEAVQAAALEVVKATAAENVQRLKAALVRLTSAVVVAETHKAGR